VWFSRWMKKRYQYLQYFMLPKHLRYEPTPVQEAIVSGVKPFLPAFRIRI
jgi:hypothetical protein